MTDTVKFFATAILTLLLASVSMLLSSASAAEPETAYTYRYHDKSIVLTPSDRLIALEADGSTLRSFAGAMRWSRDPLSDNHALLSRGVAIYQTPPSSESKQMAGAAAALREAQRTGVSAQPVFEQGDAWLVPSDEVVVAFDHHMEPDKARDFLVSRARAQGILDLQPLRPKTYIARITAPENGRAFAVSRALAAIKGIAFAEPNFVIVHLDSRPHRAVPGPDTSDLPPIQPLTPSAATDTDVPGPTQMESLKVPNSPVGWTTVLSEGFESGAPGWGFGIGEGSAEVHPVLQSYRKHTGNASIYFTGAGSQGVPPPGPYPNGVNIFLISPVLDLSPYEEAYVELWFYAKYENPGQEPYDFALIGFGIADSRQMTPVDSLTLAHTGDLTADPTTQNGWRRALFRIPPGWRTSNVILAVQFVSDASDGAEGLYIDDVRVVGTTNVDAIPLGNDPYGARGYELKNTGQIAGLGGEANDLNAPEAWAVTTLSDEIVVAVIDSGVQLNHPDLNLVTGYNADTGAVGGAPHEGEMHGTGCAGNVGAIRGNGIGTVGTAPGAKIMPIYRGGTWASHASAFDIAVQHGANILSNSWGIAGVSSSILEAAIRDALAAGRTVLFSAGNGPDRPPYSYQTSFPCNLTANIAVICVGASSPTDEHKNASSSDGEFFWGSSYVGAGPDVVAPGPWSYTTDLLGAAGSNRNAAVTGINADYTHNFGGTSSSTAKVAGVVALMLSQNPDLTPGQVKSILRNTARDIYIPGVDDRTGGGRVNARAAVIAVPTPSWLRRSAWKRALAAGQPSEETTAE